MNTNTSDLIVNKQEIEALKTMIFNRAKERASALASDVNQSYTGSIKNEVMDIARNSFVSNKNPFSLILDDEKTNLVNEEIVDETNNIEREIGLGFEQRKAESIKAEIIYRNKVNNEQVVNSAIKDNMNETRNEFTSRSSFLGALEFLNSQASIVLVNKRGKSFDAIA